MTPTNPQAKAREAMEKVGKVFAKHGFCADCGSGIMGEGRRYYPCSVLLSELAALHPAPVEVKRLDSSTVRGLFAKHHQAHTSATAWRESLIKDIVRLALPVHEPDREALIKLLDDHLIGVNKAIKDYMLVDLLMSWASPKKVEGVWCEHMMALPGGWRFQEKGTSKPVSASCWEACPVCLAHRPSSSNVGEGG